MQSPSLLSLLLLSIAVSARTSLKDSCGAGTVTAERTVTSNNHDIKVTTTSCPGFAALRNTTTSAVKRQTDIADSCSGFECDTTVVQPDIFDCDALTSALIDLGPSEEFAAPAQTLTSFSLATCLYGFANLDIFEYDVLFSNVGLSGQSLATHCFTELEPLAVFSAGFCLSPGVEGDDWIIEVLDA